MAYEDHNNINELIFQLTQNSRATGIHLIISVQRPSANIITGAIKANIPSRIAFTVSSRIESKLILDTYGAEELESNGDMLFFPQSFQNPVRVQGAFVSKAEIENVINYIKEKNYCNSCNTEQNYQKDSYNNLIKDQLFTDAGRIVTEKGKASIGLLQRVFKIGFNRAARIMDQLFDAGVVVPKEGTMPRKVLMSAEQFGSFS